MSPLSQNPPISILLFQNVSSSSSILLIDPTPNLFTLDNRFFLTMSGGRGCFNCGGCAWCFLCCFVDIYSIQRPKSCCSQSVTDLGGSPYARRKLAFTFCLPTFFFCMRVCGADVDRYLVLFPPFYILYRYRNVGGHVGVCQMSFNSGNPTSSAPSMS